MGIAEFIIGPAEGRTRWLRPSRELSRHVLASAKHRLNLNGSFSFTAQTFRGGSPSEWDY